MAKQADGLQVAKRGGDTLRIQRNLSNSIMAHEGTRKMRMITKMLFRLKSVLLFSASMERSSDRIHF